MNTVQKLLGIALLMLQAGCGTAPGRQGSGDWYDRNQADDTPVEWSLAGWDVQGLSTGSDADYLSDLEKEVLLHLNMARTNPARYAAEFLDPRLQYFYGELYREPGRPILITLEGREAVEDCISDMRDRDSMEPLQPSSELAMAAIDHAGDLSLTGETGHVGSDGSQFSQRIERYGQWLNTIGEVISYGPVTGREIVLGLLIDDGVEDDSHRRNVLNPAFGLAGISVRDHEAFGNVCVIDFAGGFIPEGSEP
jgi:hypothetical protein